VAGRLAEECRQASVDVTRVGDIAAMRWIRRRFGHPPAEDRDRDFDRALGAMADATEAGDFDAACARAAVLREVFGRGRTLRP
jgi:hypothetical protein